MAEAAAGEVEQFHHVGGLLVDIDQPGDELLLLAGFFQNLVGGHLVGGIMAVVQLLQHDAGAVVQFHFALALVVANLDLFVGRDEVELVDLDLVLLAIGIALGGAVMVVEGDARADDVDQGDASVAEGGLEQGLHLLGIAGKAAGDEGGVGGQGLSLIHI